MSTSSSPQQRPALAQLEGKVKQVLSGDTLVLSHPSKNVDKTLTLASINAPRLARRNEDKEEDFAFEAREFLRKKCIGKKVKFQVEYTNPKTGRDFGSVFLDGENLSVALLQNGLVELKVKNDKNQTDAYKELIDADEKAKQAKVGKYSEKKGNKSRKLVWGDKDFNAEARLASFKRKPKDVIVEHVLNGTSLRVLLPETNEIVVMHMTGVQAPGFKLEKVGGEKKGKDKAPAQEEGGDKKRLEVAQPFAKEARYYTEMRLLNREITVLFESSDKFGNLFGSIIISENEKSKDPVTFQEEILLQGLAKLTEWGAASSQYLPRLRAAEKIAKEKKLRIWTDYKAPAQTTTPQDNKEFAVQVIEIISGDTLRIKDDKGNEERISLASIRAPRMPSRKDAGEPFAAEARESLRRQIAGKKVMVRVDYRRSLERNVMKFNKETKKMEQTDEKETEDRRFCSVIVNGRSVAVEIVREGYASVIRHKPEEERSLFYDQLMMAEKEAESKNRGKHGKRNPGQQVNDISSETIGNIEKHVKVIAGKQTKAIVEKVLSATRYKLHLPKEGLVIIFSLNGLTSPSLRPKDSDKPKPFAREAVDYAVDNLLFREVDIIIGDKVDKTGSILGELNVKGDSFSVKLLEHGFAMLQRSASALKNYQDLKDAENKAKGPYDPEKQSEDSKYPKGINVWSVDPSVYRSAKAASNTAQKRERVDTGRFQVVREREVLTARVTSVEDINQFFIQFSDAEADLAHLEELMSQLDLDQQTAVSSVNVGDIVFAKYSVDGSWYRAKVLEGVSQKDSKVSVRYIDFGNNDRVGLSDIRPLAKDSNVGKVRPTGAAIECRLAFVYPHEEKFREEATQYFKDLVEDTDIRVVTEYTEGGVRFITIEDEDSKNETVNQTLLRDGLVFLDESLVRVRSKDPSVGSYLAKKLEALRPFQQEALKTRVGLWEDGDIYADEDDDF